MFFMVRAHPGSPEQRAVKWSLLSLLTLIAYNLTMVPPRSNVTIEHCRSHIL